MCIFMNENVWIPIEISLKFVPKGSINSNPALFQIMAWHRKYHLYTITWKNHETALFLLVCEIKDNLGKIVVLILTCLSFPKNALRLKFTSLLWNCFATGHLRWEVNIQVTCDEKSTYRSPAMRSQHRSNVGPSAEPMLTRIWCHPTWMNWNYGV